MATAFRNATCRAGDQAEYEELGYLLEGESAPIEGRNADSSWWWILNPDWQGHCWVWDGLVEVTGDTSGVPIIAVDPLPETEPEGCMVSSALGAAPVCVVPCPEGARPGTPCEPE
jgi:hypothetical protein